MYNVKQIFIYAIFCLAIINYGSLAENTVSIKNDSTHLITTVGNILTPLLLKQVERRLLNHTAISDGVISIEKLDSSTPMNIDTIITNFELKENQKSSNSSMKKLKPSTIIPTTILVPADRVQTDPKLIVDEDKLEIDSARAQQRQLESQFPFDFRNHFNIGFPGVGRQSNEGIFGNGDSFDSNQYRLLTSLDEQKPNDDISGVQGISGSQFPERNSILNGPNQPLNSQISPLDFRFQNFDKFRYDGRYSDLNQFIDQNFRTEGNFKGKIGGETSSRTGIITDIAGLVGRYNNFDRQLYPQNNLPSQYHPNLRNNFPINSAINNQAINAVNNNRPVTPSINNQGIPIGLPFRSYTNPTLTSQNINTHAGPFSQRFQNNFPDNKNTQQEYNYPQLPPQLFFPDHPGNTVSPGSITSINPQTSNNNNDNNSGVTSSSRISSRRSGDSITKPTTNIEKVTTKIPGVKSLQDHIEFEQLFFPQQDDYSDIRVSPNFFKQHILESKILEKYAKKNII